MSKKLAWLFYSFSSAFLILSGSLGSSSIAGEIKSEEYVIEKVQKSYNSALDFSTDFRQETEFRTVNRILKSWGKLYFKRPGKMLWRYEEPKGQWVLADGESLYFYQPEQGQVVKSSLQRALRSNIALSFLLGVGDLKRDFRVTLKGLEQGYYLLQLRPKGRPGEFSEILLGIECRAFDILWMHIRDMAGNITKIHFSTLQKGIGLKDSLFRLQLPDGVDVVELGQ